MEIKEFTVCCATCKNHGYGFEWRDVDGTQHCQKLHDKDETLCIMRNHNKWEHEEESNAE